MIADAPIKPMKLIILEDGTEIDIYKHTPQLQITGDKIFMTVILDSWEFKKMLKDEPKDG